ncbi:hypothetical protein CASFOL_038830 [Castilleja foliolosa]|uniref:Uncharacterized protein n=1 Tax=Castilleja foliolosa TaxID=1961234 RepID=A0ABD3BIN5_9LAMI
MSTIVHALITILGCHIILGLPHFEGPQQSNHLSVPLPLDTHHHCEH